MQCTKCKAKAVIEIRRHNAAFCRSCFTTYVHDQVAYAITHNQMFRRTDRILVAVSGGKDSLALWDILLKLGYKADALHVDLGIPSYSAKSREKVERYAEAVARPLGATLYIHMVQEGEGAGIKELAQRVHRPTCATCGTIKRYHFNRTAVAHDYEVMATGHNLDDEAARLLGNLLHWQHEYLDKQGPVLPASVEGFARKVKPLYRLAERELAAYAVLNRIDYIVEECPMAKGSKLLLYKEVLNRIEAESPGTKQRFYFGFLDRATSGERVEQPSPHTEEPYHAVGPARMIEKDQASLHPCTVCGQPTTRQICSYCRLMAQAKTTSPQ
jgi:tRNA(Ile)-lysidine synthase TilS/MesJ